FAFYLMSSYFFFSSRRRHTRSKRDWSSDVCSSDLTEELRHNFINTGYMKQMPEDIREDILKYGIRNSHLLTVAPTGSTGTMVGVSTGLEPYFSFSYFRSGRLGK